MTERAVLLLCGGRSRRLGRDKRLLDAGGKPLLYRVAEQLDQLRLPVFAGLVREDDVSSLPPGVARWWDLHPGRGPLPNLAAALERWGGELLLCPGDRLLPGAADLERLLAAADDHPEAAAVAFGSEARVDPMQALYRPAALGQLRVAWQSGRESLRDFLAALPPGRCATVARGDDGIDLNETSQIEEMRTLAWRAS